jgi:hypothetical protein
MAALCCLPCAVAQPLEIHDAVQTYADLTATTVIMTGRSELHLTGTQDLLIGSTIHLNSEDAWLFFRNLWPSVVNATYLSRVQVSGQTAAHNSNVRVVQFETGTVVIPHGPAFAPMEVFAGTHFTGRSKKLELYTYHNDSNLGSLTGNISSFRLKRGYMATVAQTADGMGASRVYIAQDGDLEVSVLPGNLQNRVGYVRVFPWRWVNKKGWAGGRGRAATMETHWYYDWGSGESSLLDREYVPMRHNEWWDGYPDHKTNVTHLLGFNEPDRPDQANMSVSRALELWPRLMRTGLRLGSPSPADSGLPWLYDFIDRADALGYRVDFVAVHFYHGCSNASAVRSWLQAIHDRTGRPLWVTEFNNGANWTGCDPTWDSNATVIQSFIDMLEDAPFVERYSIFNDVAPNRNMISSDGWITPAGRVYRDKTSTPSQAQELPAGIGSSAHYLCNGHMHDVSGNGNNGMLVGAPTFGPGLVRQAITFNGTGDYVRLPPNVGNSTNFTFAGWVKWAGGANFQRIFDFGTGTSRYFFLTPRSSAGTLRFSITTGGPNSQQFVQGPALTPGEWTHVAVTKTGSTGKLFVNGSLVATNTSMSLTPGGVGTGRNFLGRSQWRSDPLFAGSLDDVRFLNYALTDAQVAAIVANDPPAFLSNPVAAGEAFVRLPYSGSVGEAIVAEGSPVTFSKLAGPSWLSVAPDGRLNGVPGNSDVGPQGVVIRATDAVGGADLATLDLRVRREAGLVAHYHFEGNLSSSVGGVHGAANGSPVYSHGAGGRAIEFNGIDQFATLPVGLAEAEELSLAVWVRWNGGEAMQRIFDFGSDGDKTVYLTPATAGGRPRMRFVFRHGGAEQFLEAPAVMPIGEWTHVAVVLAGGRGRLFVNGHLRDDRALGIIPGYFRPANYFLGRGESLQDPFFHGAIRELQIFDGALSGAQIAGLLENQVPVFGSDAPHLPSAPVGQLYSATLAGFAADPDGGSVTYSKVSGPAWLRVAGGGALSGKPSAGDAGRNYFTIRATDRSFAAAETMIAIVVPAETGTLVHYEFNDNFNDSAGFNFATPAGAITFTEGIFGRAAMFSGSSSAQQHLVLPSGIASRNELTVAARLRWNGGGSWQRIFDFGNNTSEYMALMPRSGAGTFRFAITTGGTSTQQFVEAPFALPTGEWVHVAVTIGNGVAKLYINGASVASGPIGISPLSFSPTRNYIGRSQWSSDPYFSGAFDDFRVFGRVLNDQEIASLAIPHLGLPNNGRMITTFEQWRVASDLPQGADGPGDDPSGDGLPNLLKYLFGGDPRIPNPAVRPTAGRLAGDKLAQGADPSRDYLTLQARVRRDRAVGILPQAAFTLEGLGRPEASDHIGRAGLPVPDGDFEILTYFFETPLEELAEQRLFMRLAVPVE